MKRKIFLLSTLSLFTFLTGCTTWQPLQKETLHETNRIIEKPIYVKPPLEKLASHLTQGNDPALEKAFQRYLNTGKADNIMSDGFVQFAYHSKQQPIIATRPFQKTVISLEPGEKYTNVTCGDPSHWSYQAAYSGSDTNRQLHIILEPNSSELSSNLIIATNKRIYNLKIVSTADNKFVRDVSFWYPDELTQAVNEYNEQAKADLENQNKVDNFPQPTDLNFNYSMESSWLNAPHWKPITVFDNKQHTYIQFPASMSSDEMPALFIANGSQQELVNYRVKGHYFIVDKVFQKAILLSGGSSTQKKVTLTNHNY